MSDYDTLPPEVDDEIRARLQTFARDVADHADTETALGRMPRRWRPPAIRVVAIAACLLAVVALAAVLLDRQAARTTNPMQSPTETTDCLSTTQDEVITPGGPMKMRFAAPVASAATAIMLLGACDDGPTTLAQGEDVTFVPDESQGLATQTVNVTAEEENGEATGEFRVTNVVVSIECADTDTDGVVMLGGQVTADPEGNVGVGERMAMVIREGDPDSVALFIPDALSGGPMGINGDSCTELLTTIPASAIGDESNYAVVAADSNIETSS